MLPYWYLEELNQKHNVSDLVSTCSQQVLSPLLLLPCIVSVVLR